MHNLRSLPYLSWASLILYLIALLEALNASATVHQPLLSSEKGVTLTAKFHPELLLGGAGGKYIAAGADYLGIIIIFGVNLIFHL